MINFVLQFNDKQFPLSVFSPFIRFSVFISGSFCCFDDCCQWVEDELRDVSGVVTQSFVMTITVKARYVPFGSDLQRYWDCL